MKRLALIILFYSIISVINAQVTFYSGTPKEVEKFLGSTTCFVLKEELISDYNDKLKESVEKYWKITPYKFICQNEFSSMRFNSDYSFVVLNIVSFEGDRTQTRFDFLIATLGGKYSSIDDMPNLCAIPLTYHDAEEEDFVYKLPLVVKFIQNHINICKQNPNLDEKGINDYYNKQIYLLSEYKLYVLRDELDSDIRQKSNFSKNYDGEFEIIDQETLEEIIDNDEPNAAILHLIKPKNPNGLDRCFKLIVTADQATLLYYDMHKIKKNKPGLLLESDLKNLQK